MANLNPKKTYVSIESYGTLLVPIEHVALLKEVVVTERGYSDGKHTYKLRPSDQLSFRIFGEEEIAQIIAISKLEA